MAAVDVGVEVGAGAESLEEAEKQKQIEQKQIELTAMLKKSKEEGRKRRRRITYTCCVVGTFGIVFGAAIHRAPFYYGWSIMHPFVLSGVAILLGSSYQTIQEKMFT